VFERGYGFNALGSSLVAVAHLVGMIAIPHIQHIKGFVLTKIL
jgi:hypothetical protein